MKAKADTPFVALSIAVLTVSDTRTFDTDTSGQMFVDRLSAAGHRLAVGVEKQFVRIEPVSLQGLVGAMHAVAVKLSRFHVRQIAVPDFVGVFRKLDAGDLDTAAFVEQAKFDTLGVCGKESEVGTLSIEARAELVPLARRDMKMRALSVHLIL